ncbi:hypothetical protein FRB99_006486 [Tulasnella sp. 403]|nr:hypothetical protein FRB99_006486 [Tulasnella sp. 403]
MPPVSARSPTDPRAKISRSATSHSGSVPPNAPTRTRRSLSQDSSSQDVRAARAANTRTKSHTAVPKPKEKPSMHADIIDQLDISGVGGGSQYPFKPLVPSLTFNLAVFHHDGPFDACAPSRNRADKSHRAPMYAFDSDNAPHNVPVFDNKRTAPHPQSTLNVIAATSDGPYASASIMPPSSAMRAAPAGALTSAPHPIKPGPTRKMTLTEAWGKAEPEPFEEFSAGTIGNMNHAGNGSTRSSLDYPEAGYEAYQRGASRSNQGRRGESLDVPRRNKIPPPQPIILPGARSPGPKADPSSPGETSPSYASDYTPQKPAVKRTKSLMQRIRKMRDSPNVPVGGAITSDAGYYSEGPYSPREHAWAPGPKTQPVVEEVDERPPLPRSYTHTRGPSREHHLKHSYKPSTPDDRYVVVDNATAVAAAREKALPLPPPPKEDDSGYFDRAAGVSSNGVGRKTSLYMKVKGVVGGAKNAAK